MRLEDVTAEIRPRSDWEAVDLGFAMVRRDFWRCLFVWWMAMFPPFLIVGWFLWERPLLLLALFWWFKPFGSRMVLFELSRRLFGEQPGWKSVFREVPKVWVRRFFYRFLWARLSPWQPVTFAIEDLEGLRRSSYQQRAGQLARRGDGVVMWLYFIADTSAVWVSVALFTIAATFIPDGQDGLWQTAIATWTIDDPFNIPLILSWTAAACVMVGISLSDLFVTGAGFGIYVNNRTWLEGWDVELAFKRLGQRLTKVAAVLLLGLLFFAPFTADAREKDTHRKEDKEQITEIKEHKDFTVHFVMDKVPKDKTPPPPKSSPSLNAEALAILGKTFAFSAIFLLIAFIGWILWKNRLAFLLRGAGDGGQLKKPSARVVMGMEVTADSLPADIPSAAWALWQQGKKHEALALLYRGTISKVIDIGQVEIQESDTEGDCLRRVEGAGAAAHPDYFKGLTGAWMRLAYAGLEPADVEVESLCRSWPFLERRAA